MTDSGRDRRIYDRINFSQTGDAIVEQRMVIEIADLSAGGMAIKCNVPLEPGSICRVVLFQGNLSVESRVVSCSMVPRKRTKFRAGLKFSTDSAQLVEDILAMGKHFRGHEPRITGMLRERKQPVAIFQFPPRIIHQDIQDTVDQVDNILDEGVNQILLDFEGVKIIEKALPERILFMDGEVRYEGGRLMVSNAPPRLARSLSALASAKEINMYESIEKALRSVGKVKKDPLLEKLKET